MSNFRMLKVPTKLTAPAALVPAKLTGNVVSGDPFPFCAVTVGTTTHKLIRATISPIETSFLLILYPSHGSILIVVFQRGLPSQQLPSTERHKGIRDDYTLHRMVEQRAYLLTA